MGGTAQVVETDSCMLEVELVESAALELVGVPISFIADEIRHLGLLLGGAIAIAEEFKPRADFYERARSLDPKALKVHFGSPLQITVELGKVAGSIGSLAFLIYSLKRAWGLDLELRAHREEMRERFYVAQLRANDARSRMDAALTLGDYDTIGTQSEKISADQGWGPGATIAPGGRQRFRGKGAVLRVEDE